MGGEKEGLDLNFPTFSLSAQFRLCCGRHRAGKAQGAEEKASPCLPTVFFQGLRRPLMAGARTYDFSYRSTEIHWPPLCVGPVWGLERQQGSKHKAPALVGLMS